MATHLTSRLSQRARLAHGQPISDLMARALANPQLISLAAGFVDTATLPCDETFLAANTLLAEPQTARPALQYGTTAGFPPLRELILSRHCEADGIAAADVPSLDRVLMTAGSNQLLHLIAEALLDPGDLVLCTAPTYFVFTGILQNVDARAVGVDVDEQGMIPESLEAHLRQLDEAGELVRVKAVYLVSYYDNPRGLTMPLRRREEILEVCRRWSRHHSIYLIDDVAYRELRYEAEDVPSFLSLDPHGEHVIVAGTFSKSYAPGVRVGWGILPHELRQAVEDLKANIDFGSPNLNQHLMHQVLQLGCFDRHVQTIRQVYRTKRDAMLSAAQASLASLAGVTWIHPRGGLYLWVTLPEDIDTGPDGMLFDLAVRQGVLYVPGQYTYPVEGNPGKRNTMRLSYGVQPPHRIAEGMELLGQAIREAISA